MSTKSTVVGVLVVALLVLGVIWFTVLREPPMLPPRQGEPSEPATPARDAAARPGFFTRSGARSNAPSEPAPEIATTNVLLDWEDRVDRILGDDSEVEEKARKLLELFPHFPEPGQIETAEHIANLLPDEDFEKFGRYLTNAQTSPSVQEIIFADALNRPNAIKLPLLLQTARVPDHPMAEEARQILELYLNEDYGTNWAKWQAEIERWLKENPD